VSDEPVYRRGDVLWRRTHDRVIVLVRSNGELIALKATGCALWAALEEPGSVGQIAARLAGAYGESVEQIAADIKPTIGELRRLGVVSVSEDTSR
jgi:Coenzyme PQQ synthesis protein D (PqqD)